MQNPPESALAHETLNYSRTGAETMTRCIADAIKAEGGEVICQAEVQQSMQAIKRLPTLLTKKPVKHTNLPVMLLSQPFLSMS